MKWLGLSCLLCTGLLLATGYRLLRTDVDVEVPATTATGAAAPAPTPTATTDAGTSALATARRSCDPQQLDRLIAAQAEQLHRTPTDAALLRLCAETRLERIVLGNQPRGMVVGKPLYDELPAAAARDIDEGLEMLMRARSLGDDSATNWRLEAALLGNRITGIGSALQWNGRIEQALSKAIEKDRDDPRLHLALGLRKLLAPRFLGHDPKDALTHFEFAAANLPDDERPRVFAAMAAWLQQKRQQAIHWLEQAVAVNPANTFARAVLARVRRGEDDPFGRDLSADERR